MQDVDIASIRKQPTLTAAIKLCITMGGFESEKSLYIPLGIDAGHWSRMLKGDAHFPQDKLRPLMDLCGNEAPLVWLADVSGYELQPKESELERKLRLTEEALQQERTEKAAIIRAFKGEA